MSAAVVRLWERNPWLRAATVVACVAVGFSLWLWAHDAMAKPPRLSMGAVPLPGAKARGESATNRSKAASRHVVHAVPPSLDDRGQGGGAKAGGNGQAGVDGVVNINAANAEELQRLPGIGPSKAALIIAWRQRHRAFRRISDLRRVRGIGYKTFKKLEPYLAVSGDTTLRGR